MWPISQIAERDGISRQAVSKKVRELVAAHSLLVERDGQGRVVSVNVAQYDVLRGKTGDPSKAQAPRPASPGQPADPNETYDEALRQKTWHEAEKRRLELEELKGSLIPVARLLEAVDACRDEISRIVDALPNETDELAIVVARDGAHGLRQALKKTATKMRRDIAAALENVATADTRSEVAA